MEGLSGSCGRLLDRSIQPFGVVRLRTDGAGTPIGLIYEYVNPSMAAMTGNVPEELLGKDVYELWPTDDKVWLDHFALTALKGIACEFDATSPLLADFFHVSIFPVEDGSCGFIVQNVTEWVDQVHALLLKSPDADSLSDLQARLSVMQQQRDALQSALDLAEQGSRAKDAFLANVSHDFRTPMNAISGFAGIALDHLGEQAYVRDCLEKILLSSNHLLDLVNDILDATRIQSGKLAIACQPMSLGALLQEITSLFSETAVKRGLAFSVMVDGIRHDCIIADRTRIAQVLVNVIGNAFKFTPDDGHVTLTVTESARSGSGISTFTFTVTDTGCGMTQDFIQRIFEPFERSSTPIVSQTEGTGLGMTITKNLVDLMSGTIDVESEVGQGSTFTISLPFELDPDDDAACSCETVAPDSLSTETPDFSGMRVLVADDDDLSREVLAVTLERYGFAVDAVRDGDEAVSTFEASEVHTYDVLMLDMRMQRINGDEAARTIRAMDREDARRLPIFAVTADAFDEVLSTVREAGMTGRVTKPLEVRALLDLLAECLHR